LVANLLSWELGQSPHPLGNSIQFHSFRSDPEDLDLLDTTTLGNGGWLALTMPGLSPDQMRRALRGALTSWLQQLLLAQPYRRLRLL